MSLNTLRIATLAGEDAIVNITEDCKTIKDLKELITKEFKIPIARQILIFSGHQLKDDETLEEKKLTEGTCVHLVPIEEKKYWGRHYSKEIAQLKNQLNDTLAKERSLIAEKDKLLETIKENEQFDNKETLDNYVKIFEKTEILKKQIEELKEHHEKEKEELLTRILACHEKQKQIVLEHTKQIENCKKDMSGIENSQLSKTNEMQAQIEIFREQEIANEEYICELNSKINKLEKEKEFSDQQSADILKSSIEQAEKIVEQQGEIEEMTSQIIYLTDLKEKLDAKLQRKKDKIKNLKSKNPLSQEEYARLIQVELDYEKLEDEHSELLGDYEDLQNDFYDTELKNDKLSKENEEMKEHIEDHKQTESDLRLRLIDDMNDYELKISHLEDEITDYNENMNDQKLIENELRKEIDSLNKQIEKITELGEQASQEAYNNSKSEIAELKEKLQENEKLLKYFTGCEENLDIVLQKNTELQNKLSQTEDLYSQKVKELDSTKSELDEISKRVLDLQSLQNTNNAKAEQEYVIALEKMQDELTQKEIAKVALEEELEKLKSEHESEKASFEMIKNTFDNEKTHLNEIIEGYRKELRHQIAVVKKLKEIGNDREAEIENLERTISDQNDELASANDTINQIEYELSLKMDQIKNLNKEKDDLKIKLLSKDSDLECLGKAIDSKLKEIVNHEKCERALNDDINGLSRRVNELQLQCVTEKDKHEDTKREMVNQKASFSEKFKQVQDDMKMMKAQHENEVFNYKKIIKKLKEQLASTIPIENNEQLMKKLHMEMLLDDGITIYDLYTKSVE